jgi:spermidine synthase
MTFRIDALKERFTEIIGLYRRGLLSLPGLPRLRAWLRRAAGGLYIVLRGFSPGQRGELAAVWAAARDAIGPERLALPRTAWGVPAVLISSAAIIALETLLFHVLQVVTDYLSATSIIGLAMFGIALGGLVSFLLSRWNLLLTTAAAAAGLFLSIIHAYAAVIAIHSLAFPWPLILPFFFASFIISNVYAAGGNANILSFANSLGSGLGVLVPLLLVPLVKSETLFIILLSAPCIIILLTALRVRNIPLKAAGAVLAVFIAAAVVQAAGANLSLPESFAAETFEKKILAAVADAPGRKAAPPAEGADQARPVNRQWDFMRAVYRRDGETYRFTGDDADRARVTALLSYIGAAERFPVPGLTVKSPLSGRIDPAAIDRTVFEGELASVFALRFRTSMEGNPDFDFLSKAYVKKDGRYALEGSGYERLRAKYLLGELGFFPYYDINLDVRRHGLQRDQMKYIASNDRILLSEDNLLGRLEYGGDLKSQIMALNGVVLDSIDSYDGAHWDPRVPRVAFLDRPRVFIIGLSADGIVKSARRLPNAQVVGVEILPAIMRTMSEDGLFATLANRPYDRVEAHEGEGRSYLETDPRRWDMISLMNIHAEHGPLNTVGPENLHTVEGVKSMLDRLTDRGMIVFEEIVMNERSELAFRKFLATCRAALAGVERPERCFYLFRWDFWGENGNFRTLVLRRTPLAAKELADLDAFYEACAERYPGSKLLFRPDRKLGTTYENYILGAAPLSGTRFPVVLGAQEMSDEVLSRLDDPRDVEYLLSQYAWSGRAWSLKTYDRSAIEEDRLAGLFSRAGVPVTTDLSPVTDDKPFPYAVWGEKTEISAIVVRSLLLALLLLIPILILLLRGTEARPLILGPALCFTALSGFGFMLVEIILIQRFQLFLGSPAWNMAAVLGGMLFWSGLGSLAGRFLSRPLTAVASALIPVLLFVYLEFLPGWFRGLAGIDFGAKLAVSIFILFPISFLMGIPFPAALEAVKKHASPSLTALLWGVSGGASTVATAVGLYVNVTSGFTVSFTLGAALYAAGSAFFLLLLFLTRRKAAA